MKLRRYFRAANWLQSIPLRVGPDDLDSPGRPPAAAWLEPALAPGGLGKAEVSEH